MVKDEFIECDIKDSNSLDFSEAALFLKEHAKLLIDDKTPEELAAIETVRQKALAASKSVFSKGTKGGEVLKTWLGSR
jgi:hypothetical protein